MRVAAADFYLLHKPSECERRVYLREQGIEEAKLSPFDEVILELGRRHEEAHLRTFAEVHDISDGTPADRKERSAQALADKAPVIYQASLSATADVAGRALTLAGDPDFLVWAGDGYVVRDTKLARNPTRRDNPEIFAQLELYGWLLEQVTGSPPFGLEILSWHARDLEGPLSRRIKRDRSRFESRSDSSPDLRALRARGLVEVQRLRLLRLLLA